MDASLFRFKKDLREEMITPNFRRYQPEEQVLELVQNFIKDNFKRLPSYKEILEKTGLRVINRSLPFFQDGYLVKDRIVVNSNITYKPRRLFTIFHEITHYLILKDGETWESLNDFYKEKNQDKKFRTHLECLCNLGAAEFLIPTEELQNGIQKNGFSINSFKKLKVNFEASAPAFLIKFTYLSPVDCICLFAARGLVRPSNINQKPLFDPGKETVEDLIIEYWARSRNFPYSLRRFSIIPKDHCIRYCFESGKEVAEDSYYPFFSGKKMPCFIEAFCDKERVYGILYREKPVSKEKQIALGL